jgi:RNA polymerase sigma-70 factor, ECF subfamily
MTQPATTSVCSSIPHRTSSPELVMQPVLINGAAGVVSILDGEPFSIGGVTVRGGKIVEIDILADPERLRLLDLTILDN